MRLSLVLIAGVLVSCAGDDDSPMKLMDGSTPGPLAVELQDVPNEDVVLTSVKVTDFSDIVPDSPIAECFRQSSSPLSGPVAERFGVVSSSVTVADQGRSRRRRMRRHTWAA